MGCTNARLSDRCDTASATSEATEQPQQFGSQPQDVGATDCLQ